MFADAGITGRKTGPHTLRHTFGTMYVRSGGNLTALQKIMGHTDIKTTMIYVTLATSDVAADHARHSPVHTLLKEA
jgi:integrase/recombinase XerD